jgi:signal transduction histidine kinase
MSAIKPGAQALIRLTTTTAMVVSLLLALIPPGTYFIVKYTQLRAIIESEVSINGRLATQIVSSNPDHWKLASLHFAALLSKRAQDKAPEIRRVVTEAGELIAESADPVSGLLSVARSPMYDAGTIVGYIEISRSLASTVIFSAGIAILSVCFSLWSYIVLRRLPVNALEQALEEAAASHEKTYKAIRERDKAEEAARLRGIFLANVSHELRTPMNGVLGMLQLLKMTPLSDEQKDFIRVAQNSAGNMIDIINDILDFSKIDQGKLSITAEMFNLPEFLSQVIEPHRYRAMEKGLAFEVLTAENLPSVVTADSGRLRQILTNLLGNAIKFTATGRVILRANFVDDQVLQIEVEDTGIGISEDKLEEVFSPFTQADHSISKQFGGTGLGLTISRQLAELMGGKLWAKSVLGQGALFHLSIPVEGLAA